MVANAARLMGAGDEWGTVEPGRVANLVVVNGRPDKTIAETRRIETVICRGRIVDRAGLKYNAATDPGFRPLSAVAASR